MNLNISLKYKVLALFILTVVLMSIIVGSLFVEHHNDILIAFMAIIVLIDLISLFVMLSNAMRQYMDVAHIAEEVTRGNYNIVIPPKGSGELKKLVEAFNLMAWQVKRHDTELTHRVYQNAILKEVIERVSASLDVGEILEVISGSLGKVVSYSTVSYLTFGPHGKFIFKCHLEQSVNHAFVEDIKKKSIAAFMLAGKMTIPEEEVKSVYFGTIFDEQAKEPVNAFFSLPFFIGGKLVGMITIASTRQTAYTDEETAVLYAIVTQAGETITKIKALISEETSKVHSMLASLAEGIIMVTTTQEIAVINTKAKEIIGLGAKSEVSMLDVIQALYGKLDFRSAAERVFTSQSSETFPELTSNDILYKITAGPVRNQKGDIIGVVFIFFDITREKEIDKMKSEFISVTSHQLRTPLSSMKWFMEMLLGGDLGEVPVKQKEVLTDIYNSNERVITLVNDLLDVSRIESGKVVLEPTPTNLVDFFKSMLPEVEQNFKKRNQVFDFIKPDNLPRISVDPRLIWQTVQNLLTNASKYTPEGGKITLELTLEEKVIMLKVQDNGYGIPEFQKHRIFEKFFRADNISKMEGTGLGLYIAREIAEASGGKLWFESAEGKGTTFFFTLPLEGSKPVKIGVDPYRMSNL